MNRNFLKRKSTTYSRHLLLTREQKLNETIGDYVRALKLIAKDCEWRAVSAQEFQTELTRDAFITGLSSGSSGSHLTGFYLNKFQMCA